MLLHFLKEYHTRGKDSEIVRLFQDISRTGPANHGIGDLVSSHEISEALKAFQEWKDEGRIGMPAKYHSSQYGEISCFVTQKTGDSTLEVKKALVEVATAGKKPLWKHPKADKEAVKPREECGWYVPEPPVEANPSPSPTSAIEEWEEYEHPDTGKSWWWNERTKEARFEAPPGWPR
eukprot:symbB.v1.2.035533.t1/scaffold4807.1/size34543/3